MFSLTYNFPTTTSNSSKFGQKKVRANKVDYSTIKVKSKKVSRNTVDILTKEITSKKVCENKVDFSAIEITSKNVRGNNVHFLTIEITSKKYVETTWKFFEIWSTPCRCNIHIESTSIQGGVPVGLNIGSFS